MRERPIIFSSDMVRVILDGSKTMTRRVIKPQPPKGYEFRDDCPNPELPNHSSCLWTDGYACWRPLKRYEIGDRLWVRETYWQDQSGGIWCYKAGNAHERFLPDFPPTNCGGKAIPAIFMPHWASRITLEITGIRAEQIQNIKCGGYMFKSEVQKEGCPFETDYKTFGEQEAQWFIKKWDLLNAKRGYSFESNCWVWVIEFRRIKP